MEKKAARTIVSDIPKQLKKEARDLAKRNTKYSTLYKKAYYKPQNFQGLMLGEEVNRNRIALKLDLLAEHDPNIYRSTPASLYVSD